MLKRTMDLAVGLVGILLTWPLLLLIAFAIRLDGDGPVFFRQVRVGRYGRQFRIHKFRTMSVAGEGPGLQVTVGEDSRITRLGRLLRRYKVDELPQLIDVVLGNMSLVGPRPEVPGYVECYPPGMRDLVLSVRPGITDEASIEFRKESDLLASQDDPEGYYRRVILPRKLQIYARYVMSHSVAGDVALMWRTIVSIVRD
jgi:lipopolysaccharide/colanic/teichoic acid biosynthesis glycosyltransferase